MHQCYIWKKGLGLPEIFEAVEAGVETAVASTGIKVNLLVCAMRQQDATVNTALFDYLQQRNSQFVCGIDFAGPEVPFSQQYN
ncbi:adenosine deaminase [Staphylococcus gallinarum]|uniref:Adenosine deaminase n=1 Tax=Staphylococcus gallinarum TaxID=1293 RepID=A0A380FBG0_STAGA|nr:adenosine deaminase [Staphylococcus gallinarum]